MSNNKINPKNLKRPRLYTLIVIISILQLGGGILQITGSLPLLTLYQNIKNGVPLKLFENVSWDIFTLQKNEIEGPVGIMMQVEYFYPLQLVLGIILVALAIGLIKLRKWALYGMIILTIIELIAWIGFLFSAKYTFSPYFLTVSITTYSLSMLFALYLYSQKKFFK